MAWWRLVFRWWWTYWMVQWLSKTQVTKSKNKGRTPARCLASWSSDGLVHVRRRKGAMKVTDSCFWNYLVRKSPPVHKIWPLPGSKGINKIYPMKMFHAGLERFQGILRRRRCVLRQLRKIRRIWGTSLITLRRRRCGTKQWAQNQLH